MGPNFRLGPFAYLLRGQDLNLRSLGHEPQCGAMLQEVEALVYSQWTGARRTRGCAGHQGLPSAQTDRERPRCVSPMKGTTTTPSSTTRKSPTINPAWRFFHCDLHENPGQDCTKIARIRP